MQQSPASKEVCFVPKRPGGERPWLEFGSSPEEYRKWAPHVCGICCAKMIGDTCGLTGQLTVYELTLECLRLGGFKDEADGIRGVFHQPLLELLTRRGLAGCVERELTLERITHHLQQGCYVIASIDLAKLGTGLTGGHLLLLYGYLPAANTVVLHDCSHVLAEDGRGLQLSLDKFAALSNRKGIAVCPGASMPSPPV